MSQRPRISTIARLKKTMSKKLNNIVEDRVKAAGFTPLSNVNSCPCPGDIQLLNSDQSKFTSKSKGPMESYTLTFDMVDFDIIDVSWCKYIMK